MESKSGKISRTNSYDVNDGNEDYVQTKYNSLHVDIFKELDMDMDMDMDEVYDTKKDSYSHKEYLDKLNQTYLMKHMSTKQSAASSSTSSFPPYNHHHNHHQESYQTYITSIFMDLLDDHFEYGSIRPFNQQRFDPHMIEGFQTFVDSTIQYLEQKEKG